jgi:hypothetical protein
MSLKAKDPVIDSSSGWGDKIKTVKGSEGLAIRA